MDPMVSIIIPVYNAEITLRRCVLSVLGQQYEDFELLLIDDGTNKLAPVAMTEAGFVTVVDGTPTGTAATTVWTIGA